MDIDNASRTSSYNRVAGCVAEEMQVRSYTFEFLKITVDSNITLFALL